MLSVELAPQAAGKLTHVDGRAERQEGPLPADQSLFDDEPRLARNLASRHRRYGYRETFRRDAILRRVAG